MIALLRKRAERPSGYGAADKSDELAPPHLKPPTLQARHRIRIEFLLEGPISPLARSKKISGNGGSIVILKQGEERARSEKVRGYSRTSCLGASNDTGGIHGLGSR
jgi:hypothetical protein